MSSTSIASHRGLECFVLSAGTNGLPKSQLQNRRLAAARNVDRPDVQTLTPAECQPGSAQRSHAAARLRQSRSLCEPHAHTMTAGPVMLLDLGGAKMLRSAILGLLVLITAIPGGAALPVITSGLRL